MGSATVMLLHKLHKRLSFHMKIEFHARPDIRPHARSLTLTMAVVGFMPALFAPPCIALESVEVFTDSVRFPVTNGNISTATTGTKVEIHDLSARQRLLDEISQGLPSDPALAKELAMARLDAGGFRQRLAAAEADAALAVRYGIAKLPAIVFDRGAAVAYGLADVGQAVELYRRWQGEAQ